MINVYSNEYKTALKYLKDTKANLYNILVMAGNFNIKTGTRIYPILYTQFIVILY